MRILIGFMLGCFSLSAMAQDGLKINYVQSRQNKIRIENPEMDEEMKARANRVNRSYYELHILGSESYYKESDKADQNDMSGGDGGGLRMMVFGANTECYTNLTSKQKTEKRELNETNYLVTDSLKNYTWTFTDEQKMILEIPCFKATTKIPAPMGRRITMSSFNGQRNNVSDSTIKPAKDSITISVWYTKTIPGSFGPNFQGNLPGLILEIDKSFRNNIDVLTAESISKSPNAKLIKEPTKGKKITDAEYIVKRDALIKQMVDNMQNGGGGMRMFGGRQ